MSTPNLPVITINLEGRILPLRFKMQDYARFEGETGIPVLNELTELSKLGAYSLPVLVCVGTRHTDKRTFLSRDQALARLEHVMSLIDYDNATELDDAVASAMKQYMPKLQQGGAEKADPLAETTSGTISGPSPDTISDSPTPTSGT